MKGKTNHNPRSIGQLRQTLRDRYPELGVVSEDGKILIRGSFPVVHQSKILDRFQIEIELPPNFPDSTPIIREIGGRIPHIPDRHMNPNGEACPLVPEEWLLLFREDRTVIGFLEGPVRNFFLAESLVERGEPRPWDGRQHRRAGLLEAYGEMLGITGEPLILKFLEYLSRKEIKGHWECPCGSGKKLRNCHLAELKALRERVPCFVAQGAIKRLLCTRT
jgi:hypothetical protein